MISEEFEPIGRAQEGEASKAEAGTETKLSPEQEKLLKEAIEAANEYSRLAEQFRAMSRKFIRHPTGFSSEDDVARHERFQKRMANCLAAIQKALNAEVPLERINVGPQERLNKMNKKMDDRLREMGALE